jgi:Skp family chaperone for outer membrane proteins
MKKNIIFFIFFFFISNNNTLADNSISFIDVDYIYSNSIIGKKINDKLNTESTKIKEELSNYQKEIQDEKDKLINQKKLFLTKNLKKKQLI